MRVRLRSQWKKARGLSIGTKLAAMTVGLMTLVSVGMYYALSHSLAEALLSSKAETARALSSLFTSSVSAAVEFEDREGIRDTLKHLARNPDVSLAGVWSGTHGSVGERLGHYSRSGRAEQSKPAPGETSRLEWSSENLSVTEPVRNQSGQIIAYGAVVFSLADENTQIDSSRRRVLVTSFGVAAAIVLSLIVMSRRTVIVPLKRLQAGARQLERGELAAFDTESDDEVGELASALQQMALAVSEREAEIMRRNRDMRVVMDNVGQGLMTLDEHGVVSDEHSRVIEEWFGKPASAEPFATYVARADAKFASWFESSFRQLVSGVIPSELALAQLPRRLKLGGTTWRFEYRPLIAEGDRLEKLVIVITDITPILERQRLEREQREIVAAFARATRDRPGFVAVLSEVEAWVSAVEASGPQESAQARRHIHTLAGVFGIIEAHSLVELCHELEARLCDADRAPSPEEKRELRASWDNYAARIRAYVVSDDGIRLHRSRYLAFLEAIRSGAPRRELLAQASTWTYEDTQQHLERLGDHARALAARLGKGDIEVQIDSSGVRLPPNSCAELWSVLVHAVRNAVDHGLEPAREREALGKPARGRLTLSTRLTHGTLAVAIGDDGRGIDWERIRQKARQLGLPAETAADLERALFSDGLTTRTDTTTTSGRGIGTSALDATVRNLGGWIEVESIAGQSTTFRCMVPSQHIFGSDSDVVRTPEPPGVPSAPTDDEPRHAMARSHGPVARS
jgi:HPt (histidine-containing phosphotransfer) domain-containing protein/HAMP domain-containing protein